MQDGDSGDSVELEGERGASRGDVVLMADPSAEGETVAAALRAHGYHVVDAPIALLGARFLGESPRVLVIDLTQAGAFDALEHVREAAGLGTTELICIGDAARAAELGVPSSSGRVFDRPIDIDRLIEQVEAFAAPSRRGARGTTPPPSFAPRRETSPPLAGEAEGDGAPPSDFPPAIDALDVASILPGPDEAPGAARLIHAAFSPELERILGDAARRLGSEASPSSVPLPDEELDLILSPELLATLDEPLDPEDDGLGTGSGLGTGAPPGQQPGTRGGTSSGGASPGTNSGARMSDTGAGTGDGSAELTGPAGGSSAAPFGLTPIPRSRTNTELATPADLLAAGRMPAPPALPRPEFVATPSSMALSRDFDELPPSVSQPFPEVGRSTRPPPAVSPPAETPPPPAPQRSPTATITGMASSLVGGGSRIVIPPVLGEGDAVRALARAIASRASGSLALNTDRGLRRVVLQDGDIVTAGSGIADETLLSFLAARGDLERDAASRLAGKLPPFGRHAGAALIAHGHLGQDDLWPVLRAHAEWIIGRALLEDSGTCELEDEPPGRFKAEPSVFGGATGAEVFVETLRRVIPPDLAARRLGGMMTRLDEGPRRSILGECALGAGEDESIRAAPGKTLGEIAGGFEPELVTVVYACVSLEILSALVAVARDDARSAGVDPLDEEAIRARVRARLALVEDGDYFALLGVPRGATSYEIRRAYLELRRTLEPSRLLTATTADLSAELRVILEVLDEAFDILKEPHRRDRYRRAIEAGPP